MLSKFSVSNYKTFETTVSIAFDQPGNYSYHKECIQNGLVAKAVIIGKNASGKFNLGKAILDIKQVLRGDKGEALVIPENVSLMRTLIYLLLHLIMNSSLLLQK